jgi:hypothetical protein
MAFYPPVNCFFKRLHYYCWVPIIDCKTQEVNDFDLIVFVISKTWTKLGQLSQNCIGPALGYDCALVL